MTSLGKQVPIGKISAELKELWASDIERTNACLMNLAVFTEDHTRLEKNSEWISEITREHSCRALSVALERDSEEKTITSWVTAHCNMMSGKKTVCCEQLTFHLKGFRPGRLRNTVFANLNSDLPLVFWWQGELSEVFEPRLYTLIDRFVYDSEDWADPVESYQRVIDAAAEVQQRFILQDLAWTRSYHMRLAFARLFDEERARQQFSALMKASVTVAEGYETTGRFLIAWLATQAQWSLLKKDGMTYHFKNSEGGQITVELKFQGDYPVNEMSVSSDESCFTVKYTEETGLYHQTLSCDSSEYEMSSHAGEINTITLVADQLSRGGKNNLLLKVIPLFLEL